MRQTTDAPAPKLKLHESETLLVQDGIKRTAVNLIAKGINDLYALECLRLTSFGLADVSRVVLPTFEEWINDPRFEGVMKPYGLEETRQAVMEYRQAQVDDFMNG